MPGARGICLKLLECDRAVAGFGTISALEQGIVPALDMPLLEQEWSSLRHAFWKQNIDPCGIISLSTMWTCYTESIGDKDSSRNSIKGLGLLENSQKCLGYFL